LQPTEITEDQADKYLMEDVKEIFLEIKDLIVSRLYLNENQMVSLISFAFSIGKENFKKTNLIQN